LHKQKQNGNHQRRSNVDNSLASRERLRFKELDCVIYCVFCAFHSIF